MRSMERGVITRAAAAARALFVAAASATPRRGFSKNKTEGAGGRSGGGRGGAGSH